MDFELSEEQRLLKDSVERLVADRYDFSARQRFMQKPTGFSRELWHQYAELGLLGLPFSEKDGGIGGGGVAGPVRVGAGGGLAGALAVARTTPVRAVISS